MTTPSNLEAIRARWEAATPLGWPWDDDTVYLASQHPPKVHAIANAPADVAWLLAEVERYKDAFVRANEAVTAREIEIERLRAALAPVAPDAEPKCSCGSRDAYSATPGEWIDHQPDACRIMQATDPSLAPGVDAPAEHEPGTPLAGLASAREANTEHAEPTEWEWSTDDVVQATDGAVWARHTDARAYPWLSVGGSDQRDQDITDLVTKHGGRVLVCKARGIGGAS